MKIVILAPSHKSNIHKFIPKYELQNLPEGYYGAPFISTLIEELLNKGHEITAITTTKAIDLNYDIKEFVGENFKWIVVPVRKHSIRFNGLRLGYVLDFYSYERRQLKKVTFAQNSDFIHAHWSYEFASVVCKNPTPGLVTIHDNPYLVLKFTRDLHRLVRLLMSEWILRKLKFVSTVSPYMKKYAEGRCSTVKIIPNPTVVKYSSCEIIHLIDKKIDTLVSPKYIMIMNGWDDRKNGNAGLKAFQYILEKLPSSSLDLFGQGTQPSGPAWDAANMMRLKNTKFHGPVSHEILLNFISEAHILIHPSKEESFGVVLIEAMACGVPVIGGTNSGAVPWVIDNSALLVDVMDPQSIANKAIELTACAELYKEVSEKSYQNVLNRFSAEAVTTEYTKYYNEIINK